MASKLVISCDQCGTETTNADPHAHPHIGGGALPMGWTELRITTTEPVPASLPAAPAWARNRNRDVIDAELEPDAHVHLMPVGKGLVLCGPCASKLLVRVGDVAPRFIPDERLSVVGPRGRILG